MVPNLCGTTVPAWKKRWMDYCMSLKTIETLEGALEMARTSARDQLAEVRQLAEDEMRGPAPTGEDASRNSGGTPVQRHRPLPPGLVQRELP